MGINKINKINKNGIPWNSIMFLFDINFNVNQTNLKMFSLNFSLRILLLKIENLKIFFIFAEKSSILKSTFCLAQN